MSSVYGKVTAQVYPVLRIKIQSFNSMHKGAATVRNVDIDPNPSYRYRIVAFNPKTSTLDEYRCRIIGYTLEKIRETNAFLDAKTIFEVSSINIDCSVKDFADIRTINVEDIRDVDCIDGEYKITEVQPKIHTLI